MSEEKEVQQVVEPEVTTEPKPDAVPEQPVEQKGVSIGDLKVGYVVGLTEKGDFVFDLVGKTRGLVETLGLHQHATSCVKRLYDRTQVSGDTLVEEVGKGMLALNQKLDRVVQVVAPKKPDNEL